MKKNDSKYVPVIFAGLLLIGGSLFCACAKEDKPKQASAGKQSTEEKGNLSETGAEKIESLPADPEALSKGVRELNRKLFAALTEQNGEENLFYSPFSMESALSAILAGAEGETAQQMKEVLSVDDPEVFLSSYRSFREGLPEDGVKLTTADSLWLDKTFLKNNGGVRQEYADKLEYYMNAEVRETDFKEKTKSALKDISEWVDDKTEGMIPDYSPVADENTVLDLINTIYFFGEWEHKFAAEDTFNHEFRGLKTVADVPTMHQDNVFLKYAESENFRAVELPYQGGTAAMDLILPVEEAPEDSSALSPKTDWTKLFSEEETVLSDLVSAEEVKISELALPKFTEDKSLDGLKETLEGLGIRDAFLPEKADLSGIAEQLYLTDIAHRAKIEVDEEGSRAAAVTEITAALTAMPVQEENRIEFICDRPFCFIIRESRTNTVLFTGLMNEMH